MAKETPKEAPIVVPEGLELDAEYTPVSSDDNGLVVEKDGKQFLITPCDHPAVAWEWTPLVK